MKHPAAQNGTERFRLTGRVKLALAVAILCLAGLLIIARFYPKEQRLNGLLVDLELNSPDPGRYNELRDVLTRRLQAEVASLRNLQVGLTYVHFTELSPHILNPDRFDFLILSPQSTPWHMYRDEAGRRLESVKDLLRQSILNDGMPALGICGGHQFLALAFGGAVDFIDPRFEGSYPERYPKEAVAERGRIALQTIKDDPIFEGLAVHPGFFEVMESHYEEVKAVPPPFINLAKSDMSEAQLMRIPGKSVYGMAFHPERGWDLEHDSAVSPTAGKQILANFLRMVARKKP